MLAALTLSLGLTLAAPVLAASGTLRTAVIAVGADDAVTQEGTVSSGMAAGALQRELEISLGRRVPGVEIVPASLVGPALAGATATSPAPPPSLPPADPGATQAWEALFERVERSFVEDRLPEALQILVQIERLQHRTRFVPTSERARLLLWRATVHLAQGDSNTAEQRVRAALALDPSAPIDPAVFPPSVRKLGENVTSSDFRRVKLRVTGAPEGSVVLVDGRPVPEKGIPVGSHVLAVGAAGFRWVEVALPDVQADRDIEVALPLAPPAATEQVLRDMARAGTDTVPEFRPLQELAKTIDADALVIVTHVQPKASDTGEPCENGTTDVTGRKITGVFWRRSWSGSLVAAPRSYTDDEAGRRAFALWLEGVLGDASRGFFASIGTTVSASAGPSIRHVTFYDSDHDGYETAFSGMGGAVGVSVAPGRWYASVEASGAHYGFIGVQISRPGDARDEEGGPRRNETDASGGYVFGGQLSAGRRFLVKGDSFERGIWWSFELAGGWQRRKADDVNELAIFPSHERVVSGPRIRGGVPVPWTSVVLEGAFMAHAYLDWREYPAGTSGTNPTADPRGSAELVARWQRSRSRVRWAGGLQFESNSISFGGRARMPVQPAITGARRDEDIFALLVRVEWTP